MNILEEKNLIFAKAEIQGEVWTLNMLLRWYFSFKIKVSFFSWLIVIPDLFKIKSIVIIDYLLDLKYMYPNSELVF